MDIRIWAIIYVLLAVSVIICVYLSIPSEEDVTDQVSLEELTNIVLREISGD